MFINHGPCFGIISSYRLIWICGKFGGHKTSLSLAIAEEYLKQGYYLITNNRNVWADDYKNLQLDDKGHLNAVVLLDEGGLYFKASRQIEQIASYANKMNCIYIIPSFWPPARSAQVLKIQPLFSLKSAGLPIIFYKWQVDIGGFHDKGWFIWAFPQEIYGIYSRQDPGDDPQDIIDFLIKKTGEFREFYGRKDKIYELGEPEPTDLFADAVNDLTETISEYGSALSSRKRNNKR